jgi:hypothetical protein
MWLLGFDPQQISPILKRCDAIQHTPILARTLAELEKVAGKPLGPHQFSVNIDNNIAIASGCRINLFAIQEAVIAITKIARFMAYRNLFCKACPQRICPGNNDAIFNPKL